MARPVPPVPVDAPVVTVQLPVRNEAEMIAPLVRCATALDWPRDRLELQVLDDSDDETPAAVDRAVAEQRAMGVPISAVRRGERRGYKAGALAHGLSLAEGSEVLILDADFRPAPDLLRALHARLATDDALAFVQARWSFRNEDASLLTRVQAAILDGLFLVEQARLSAEGAPVQFNGTAGLWRRSAIEAAGGWHTGDDALTEDLDLSFRAHELGLRGVTLDEQVVSTELPEGMAAFREQQARWVRGGGLALHASGLRLLRHASTKDARVMLAHLARHARQPLFVAAILRLPLVAFGYATPICAPFIGPLAVAAVAMSASLYLGAARKRRGARRDLLLGPALVALSVGLAPRLTRAFLGGVLGGDGGGFVRTPKGTAARRSRTEWSGLVLVATSAAAALGFVRSGDVTGAVEAVAVAASLAWVAR